MIGGFNYISRGNRERSEYDRIELELDTLESNLDPNNMNNEQLAEFCQRFETALNAKKHLIKTIAEDCNISPEKVIAISDGKLYYKYSQSCDQEKINCDVTEKSKEDFGNGKNGLDSVEETVVNNDCTKR